MLSQAAQLGRQVHAERPILEIKTTPVYKLSLHNYHRFLSIKKTATTQEQKSSR